MTRPIVKQTLKQVSLDWSCLAHISLLTFLRLPVKSRLDGIQQQLSEVPKEVQTVVEASLAVAVLQKPEAPPTRASTPSPPPAPDTDTPGQPTVRISDPEQVVASPAPLAETAQANKGPASAPQSQGKKSGTSLLRKVSLGLAGMANMATAGGVHTGPRVGGPRKMGAGRLFGNLPPGATAPDAKDRWNPNRYKTGGPTALDQPKQDMPPPDVPEIQPNDQQAQLMEALEGFEKQMAEDTGENDEQTTVIALG